MIATMSSFQEQIRQGIPDELPEAPKFDSTVSHAPKRKDILTADEKKLAIRNALRYFPARHHTALAKEFAEELAAFGRIYMHRFRPSYTMHARPIGEYPHKSLQAAAIMLMIQNNLDIVRRVRRHRRKSLIDGARREQLAEGRPRPAQSSA